MISSSSNGWFPVEWQLFCDHVESQFSSQKDYLEQEGELAMREYINDDGYADLEEKIGWIVRTTGRTLGVSSKEKSLMERMGHLTAAAIVNNVLRRPMAPDHRQR